MNSDASSTDSRPTAPKLFISYASEDREAARRLRDALGAHAIEVWYDEDNLTGGDAWDQKIRQRIRECDFFMPVISLATQARREGYFRREWRQAAERTLDMADDVMFIVPVNIDDIPEAGARVPERFAHVQWTRCPAGESNAALDELCHRMLHDDDPAATAFAHPPRAAAVAPKAPKSVKAALPPYPPQPHRKPDEAGWLHVFNLWVWVVRCGYRAYIGFPRILRFIIIAWLCFFLLGRCGNSNNNAPATDDGAPSSSPSLINFDAAADEEDSPGLGKLGEILGAVADAAQSGRPLALVPFTYTSAEPTNEAFTKAVFQQLLETLEATRPDQVALSPTTIGPEPSTTDLIARTARISSAYLLTGWAAIDPVDAHVSLHVILHESTTQQVVWTEEFPVEINQVAATVDTIHAAILANHVFQPATPAQTP